MDAVEPGRIALLADRGVVKVGGPEAEDFLQNLVTNDMKRAASEGAGYGALLTPQGKILFDFLLYPSGSDWLFDLPKTMAADFQKRLGFYRLRAKVEIADLSETHHVLAAWGG